MTIRTMVAVLVVFPVIGFAADAPKLDVRMGLWESTATTTFTGMPAMPSSAEKAMAAAIGHLTPEQRAQLAGLQAQMHERQGMPQVHKERSCMSREKMEKNGFFGDQDTKGHCTHTITQNDGRTMAATFTCEDKESSGKGQMVFTANSPTSVKGTLDMSMTVTGKPMTTHTELQSQWVAADCGDVK